jgi:hypothetical protein
MCPKLASGLEMGTHQLVGTTYIWMLGRDVQPGEPSTNERLLQVLLGDELGTGRFFIGGNAIDNET